jgi:tetratricopeptide (TPR) repeat protein
VGRNEDALTVLQAILIHHREDLTDFEVVEIYWQLGEVQKKLGQHELAENHYAKGLAIDPGHEPSLRALIALAEEAGRFEKSAEYRNSLISVLEDEQKFQAAVELGRLAREKLNEPHMAIDAYVTAHKLDPDSLEVMDALYPLYRQTRQGHKAAEILERMLEQPQVTSKKEIARKVWFTLGEIARDELRELDRAITAFNASLDVDPTFIDAFSAIEQLLGSQKQWKALEENYAKMIQRLPKGEATNPARLALWKALGDLYLKVLKQPDAARMAYQVVAAASPEDAQVQELYAQLCAQTPGQEDAAIDAYRKAISRSQNPGRIGQALAELFARKKDYDGAYLAALAVQATGTPLGEGEQEILSKLAGYAKRKEVAQKALTDRLWTSHLLHPKTRGPLGELLAILFEQAGHLYAVPHTQSQLNPKKHRIDVASAQEYQIHHYRYVARLLGLESVELFSPFLVATRERLAKRSGEPAPDTLVGVELCHTHPACLKVGGKYFGEPGQKEVYYLLGRTLAMLRPELALTQRLAPARLEAVIQAAVSLVIHSFRPTVRPEALEGERKLLEKALPEPGRAALGRVAAQYVKSVTARTFTDFLEGAELTGLRAGFFVAGEVEPVRKMIQGETGAAFRVATPVKIRDLVGFAVSDDLKVLRTSVGVQVEISRN